MGSKMETTYHYFDGNLVKDMHCQGEKLEVVDALQGDKNVVITQETMQRMAFLTDLRVNRDR